MTAAVTQKHVMTMRRMKRGVSDIDVTKSIQDVQTRVLLVRCKCTENFPVLSPADLLCGRSQMTSMKRNTKINFSSVSRELVYFPMEKQQRIIHISSKILSTNCLALICVLKSFSMDNVRTKCIAEVVLCV